jgi:hypothetical protein
MSLVGTRAGISAALRPSTPSQQVKVRCGTGTGRHWEESTNAEPRRSAGERGVESRINRIQRYMSPSEFVLTFRCGSIWRCIGIEGQDSCQLLAINTESAYDRRKSTIHCVWPSESSVSDLFIAAVFTHYPSIFIHPCPGTFPLAPSYMRILRQFLRSL